jgi:predicted glycosyltransferase
MNREAAALGVPVYSIFRGRLGAVDEYLARKGRLILLESVHDVQTKIVLARRNGPAKPENGNGTALQSIVNQIHKIMQSECRATAHEDE